MGAVNEEIKYISCRNVLKRVEKIRPVKLFYQSSDEFQAAMHIFNEVKNVIAHTRIERNVATVAHGRWIDEDSKYYGRCYNCARVAYTTPYCPYCGAKMDEVIEND